MIGLWVPITVSAAFLQCIRTALQRRLTATLSVDGANFVRYVYGAPVAAVLFAMVALTSDAPAPSPSWRYLGFCLLGGVSQIVATSLLIHAFALRNFAVGTAYSKTETIQTALFSTIFLAEPLSEAGWLGVVVSLAGVLALSVGPKVTLRELALGWTQPAALVGLASGACFAGSAIGIRAAALSLGDGDFLLRSTMTLATITLLQTLLMAPYLAWRTPGEIGRVLANWRSATPVGLLSVFGSACWFAAMTLQNAALVRALGQVELIFTVIVSRFGFREPPSARELVGMALIAGGVVTVLAFR
ncbi:MAG TPA: DMT family transporter [Alphaproteobacteria bacterium]|nr:DMT family transporter [Alphaproteobacteria bacterium]